MREINYLHRCVYLSRVHFLTDHLVYQYKLSLDNAIKKTNLILICWIHDICSVSAGI